MEGREAVPSGRESVCAPQLAAGISSLSHSLVCMGWMGRKEGVGCIGLP